MQNEGRCTGPLIRVLVLRWTNQHSNVNIPEHQRCVVKRSTVIRFVLAVVFGTLACVALLAHVPGVPILFMFLGSLLVTGTKEYTRPLSRKEGRQTIFWTAVFLAVMFTGIFLNLRSKAVPARDFPSDFSSHPGFVVPVWLCWLAVIYYQWKRQRIFDSTATPYSEPP